MVEFLKKSGKAIAATVGFIGVAGFALFFMEASVSGNLNPSVPANNLAADIDANAPVGTTDGAAAAAQLLGGDAQATTTAVLGTDSSTVITASSTDADISDSSTAVVLDAEPAPVEQVAPAVPPPTSEPISSSSDLPVPTLAPTSTVATTTVQITVTPTEVSAPQPAVPPPVSLPPQSSNATLPGLALPYSKSNFNGDGNWQLVWGNMALTSDGFMDMSAGIGNTGGAIYLKNSGNWSNYIFNATVGWVSGESFGLMADYQDQSNYVLCEYDASGPGKVTIQLKQYQASRETDLTPSMVFPWNGEGDASVSVVADGQHATCGFNGNTLSNANIGPDISLISPAAGTGGIGFTMQDLNPNVSQIIVKQVGVVLKS